MFSKIQAEDSNLPRSLYLAAKDYHSGFSFKTIGLSFEQWGLDKLVRQLLGPKPGSTRNLFNVMGRRRFAREASAEDRKEIEDAVSIYYFFFQCSAITSHPFTELVLEVLRTNRLSAVVEIG